MKRISILSVLVCPALFVTASPAVGQVRIPTTTTTYTLTDLHPANTTALYSIAYAINNSGRVAGQASTPTGSPHAFQSAPNAPFVQGAPDDLGVLAGEITSTAWAINNKGLIAGDSEPPGDAFQFVPGTGLEKLNVPGNFVIGNAGSTHAAAINDFGWIAGGFWTTASDYMRPLKSHALISFGPGWTQSLDFDLGSPAYSIANDVNNYGQLVGHLGRNATDQPVAYFFDLNTLRLTILGTLPGGSMSFATALNDSGAVVGYSTVPPSPDAPGDVAQHAFLFRDLNHNGVADPGEMIDLSAGVMSAATAINTGGVVVGYCGGFNATLAYSKACIFLNGKTVDLNTLVPAGTGGWTLRAAYGINDSGQIVGYMQSATGVVHAFRLDPIVHTLL